MSLPESVLPSNKFLSLKEFITELKSMNIEVYENISYSTYNLLMKAHNKHIFSTKYELSKNYSKTLSIIKSGFNIETVAIIKMDETYV